MTNGFISTQFPLSLPNRELLLSFITDFDQQFFDPRGVPQTPRFTARPNPVSNPQFSRAPISSQQRNSFNSERPLRTQRALPRNKDQKSLEQQDAHEPIYPRRIQTKTD